LLEKERVENPQLDQTGKKLAKDTEQLLEASKRFLEEKNPDELMQKMVKEGQEAVKEMAEGIKYSDFPNISSADIEEIQKESKILYENVRDLVLASIRSGDLREFLGDGIQILQNLLEVKKRQIKEEATKTEFTYEVKGKGMGMEEPMEIEGKEGKKKEQMKGELKGLKEELKEIKEDIVELPEEEKLKLRDQTFDLFIKWLSKMWK